MDKRFFRRCARNAAFSLLGCLLLAAPAFAAQEITVSGAASLTNAFTEIKGLFEKKYPDIKVHTNFAASNPLLKQMEEGAPVDVFASADQETMDKAAAKKLVDTATRKDFALNDLVMVVPSDSKLNLNGAKDLAKPEVKRIAVGNPDSVPAGRYTKAALTTAGLWETLQPKYVFGASVRQALDYVGRGEVDAGFVYRTDAKQGNMPTALAQKMGAEELVCVDLEGVGITRPNRTGLPTTLIRSYWELGDILHFEPATARRNIELGYHDTLRAFGRLRGCAYAVDSGAESSADAAAFHAAFEAVQKDVREKHPSTLTADAALLLAKLSDAELAPLEAVAEDVGVDPAPYYTTRTLGEAFLAKCDFERLRSFEPLFKGEAGPAQAARAALLPNTFLQALVCRALTGRVPPEEMET